MPAIPIHIPYIRDWYEGTHREASHQRLGTTYFARWSRSVALYGSKRQVFPAAFHVCSHVDIYHYCISAAAASNHLLIRLISIQDQSLEEPDSLHDRGGFGMLVDGVDASTVFEGCVAESVLGGKTVRR